MPRRPPPKTNLPVERGTFVGRVKLLDEIARHVDGGARVVSLVGPEGIGKTRVALRAAALELPRFGARGGVWLVQKPRSSDAVVDEETALIREVLMVLGLMPDATGTLESELARATAALKEAGPTLLVVDALPTVHSLAGRAPPITSPGLSALAATVTARKGTLTDDDGVAASAESNPGSRAVEKERATPVTAPSTTMTGSARAVEKLVAGAPELRVMTTSRAKPGIADERVVTVPHLKLAKQAQQDVRTLTSAEAVQLFIERAGEAKRGYAPGAADVHAIAQIVRQLDGVPLAIEIAAARLRALSAPELLERLPRKVALLVTQASATSGGPVISASGSRATLAGAVAWSLDLLPPWEQSALAQAAVFRGGFDADAADAVIDLSAFADAPSVGGALECLLEKSLVRVQDAPTRSRAENSGSISRESDDVKRFDMPAVVREFAEARLGPESQRETLANRHAAHYLKVCGAWAESVDGHGGLTFRRRLEQESENLLAVVRRSLMADPQSLTSISTALRGVLALEPVLTTRGPHDLFLDLLDRALEPADAVGVPYALRAKALEARGRSRRHRHQLSASLADLEAALQCARKARDKLLEARALANVGTHFLFLDKHDLAERTYQDALRLLDEVGERRVYARALGFFGLLDHRRGKLDAAVKRYQEALAIHKDCGDRRWEGIHEGQLGAVLLEAEKVDDARSHLKRALAIHRELQNRRNEAIVLSWLGDADAARGDLDDARALWERALALHRQVGDPRGEATALARLGALAARGSLTAVAEELFLRARELVDRLDDASLTEMLAVLERRIPTKLAGPREPARAAGRIARILE